MLACFCDESQICSKKVKIKAAALGERLTANVDAPTPLADLTTVWVRDTIKPLELHAFLWQSHLWDFLIFFAKEFTKIFFFFKPKGKIIAEMKSSNAVTVSAAIKGFSPLSNFRLPFKILVSPTLLRLSLCLLLRPFNKQTPRTRSIVGTPCGAN